MAPATFTAPETAGWGRFSRSSWAPEPVPEVKSKATLLLLFQAPWGSRRDTSAGESDGGIPGCPLSRRSSRVPSRKLLWALQPPWRGAESLHLWCPGPCLPAVLARGALPYDGADSWWRGLERPRCLGRVSGISSCRRAPDGDVPGSEPRSAGPGAAARAACGGRSPGGQAGVAPQCYSGRCSHHLGPQTLGSSAGAGHRHLQVGGL